MPVITELSQQVVLIPDESVDSQKRVAGTLAGTRGSSVAETTGEHDPVLDEHQAIGFRSPTERKRIDALLAELHSFLNPASPENTAALDGPPQET